MKKNVLHLLVSNSFSGAENVVCTIIDNDSKYKMFYCCPDGPIRNELLKRNIDFIPLKKLNPFEVKKICKKYNINIIHAHDLKASFIAGVSGFRGRIISHLHGNHKYNNYWNIFSLAYKFVERKFAKVICVSSEVVNNAVYVNKKNHNKYEVIKNVVDSKNVIRKSDEFIAEESDIVFLARLIKLKRPEWVVEIVNKLKDKYPKIKAIIIGTGDQEEHLKELINEYHLEKNVILKGFQSNPFPYVKKSKISLLPSEREGLPMSVIECMVLGIPVLNCGVDGLGTLFKNDKEFICKDIEEYVYKIDLILSKKLKLKEKCKIIIASSIDIDGYINKINKIYEGDK